MKHKVIAIALALAMSLSGTTALAAQNTTNNKNTGYNSYIQDLYYYYYYYNTNQNKPNTGNPGNNGDNWWGNGSGSNNGSTNKPGNGNNNNGNNNNGNNNGNNGGNNSGNNNSGNVSGSVSSYEKQVLTLVNAERSKNGLAPLTMDSSVSNVARVKSKDMAQNNYFSHTSPTYGNAANMLKQYNIKYSAYGENIASGQRTPEAVVKAWMNSSGHRANILSSTFTKLGVGYATNAKSTPYWTQIFIK